MPTVANRLDWLWEKISLTEVIQFFHTAKFVISVGFAEKHSDTCRQGLKKLRAEIDSGYADKTKASLQLHGSNMQPRQQNDLSAGAEENTCEADGGNAKG